MLLTHMTVTVIHLLLSACHIDHLKHTWDGLTVSCEIYKRLLCIIPSVLHSHLDLSQFSSRSARAPVGQFAMGFQLFHSLVRIFGLFLCRSWFFTPLPQFPLKLLKRWNGKFENRAVEERFDLLLICLVKYFFVS